MDTLRSSATLFTPPKPSSGLSAAGQQGRPVAAQLPSLHVSRTLLRPAGPQASGVRIALAASPDKDDTQTIASSVLPEESGAGTTAAGKHRRLVPELPLISPLTADLKSAPAKQLSSMQTSALQPCSTQNADVDGTGKRASAKKALYHGDLTAMYPAKKLISEGGSSAGKRDSSRQEACKAPMKDSSKQQGEMQEPKSKTSEMLAGQNTLSVFSFL
jgi:hypothetical protein